MEWMGWVREPTPNETHDWDISCFVLYKTLYPPRKYYENMIENWRFIQLCENGYLELMKIYFTSWYTQNNSHDCIKIAIEHEYKHVLKWIYGITRKFI
jgi:hypothetical protein